MAYTYNASRSALLTPARNTVFFPAGRPESEAALCAEAARLVYAPFDRDMQARSEVRESLRRAGFSSCTFVSAGGTQALLARDRDAALSILVFRGTELDPRDWATDLDVLPVAWPRGGLVHQGFAAALDGIWQELAPALDPAAGRLLYTGHSLGAALATLAASHLPPHALHTFGCPRVGDAAFAQAISAVPHHRFVNCCDIVCRVPPESFGYRHAGPARYLDRTGKLHLSPAEAMVKHDQSRARRTYLLRWAWRRGTLWTRDAADHTPVNYVTAVTRLPASSPDG